MLSFKKKLTITVCFSNFFIRNIFFIKIQAKLGLEIKKI